jgi:CBS domain-containing protein
MASLDPATYLRTVPPFDALPEDLYERAVRGVDVVYFPAGARVARAGGQPLEHLHVIRKGAVRLERDGQTLQLLEEGELFGYTSLLSGAATLDVVAHEELVAYRVSGDEFRRLLAADPRFAGHFAAGMAERLKASLEQPKATAFRADLVLEVGRLLRRPARWIDPGATVQDAARVMRDEQISSVLVRGDPPAIVTDRDLRNRVLADELGPETAVTRVASSPVLTVPASTPVYAAWRSFLDGGVHHLAVQRDGEIAGVLTSSDLLRHSAKGPVAVLRHVERLPGRAALPGYAAQIAEMASSLVAGGLDAVAIGGFVARINDVLTHRLLRWAEADMGAPPAPYAWLVFGSEGRMEQTLLTDQDNGLAYADEGAAHRDWYQAFAERVNLDLETAGFPPCTGGHMARNEHGTLSEWKAKLDRCVDEPNAHDAELYFDLRAVGGHLDVAPLEAPIARAAKSGILLHLLAREALEFSPPGALVLRLKGDDSVVDLKRHGLIPLVFLARTHALEVGSPARSTTDRIAAAQKAGLLGADAAGGLAEAFRFLLALRLRVQLRTMEGGGAPTNQVALALLSPVERSRLRESFRAIKAWQATAARHYHVTDR